MQLALRSDSSGQILRAGPRKFMAAGVAVIGAGLIAANPLAPNVAVDIQHKVVADIQHRAVKLTDAASDVAGAYDSLVSTTNTNLQTLGNEAGIAFPRLLNQIAVNLQGTASIFDTAVTGTQTALQDAMYGGFYGSDDGYVFGLIGGPLTSKSGVTESGSTVAEIVHALQQGNLFNAFGYFDEWSLESLQHVTKPLLSPLLSTARTGSTPSPTLINTFLQSLLNLDNGVLTYSNLQGLFKAATSPLIGFTFGALADVGKIGGDVAALNLGGALTDLAKAPADIVGDLLNGYTYPGATSPFTGLLNNGGIFQDLLYTWPNLISTALGAKTTASATNVAASLSGGLAQATSLLPSLATLAAQPAAIAANLSASLSPLLANLAAQLSATLAPNLISGLLLHLPALLLAML